MVTAQLAATRVNGSNPTSHFKVIERYAAAKHFSIVLREIKGTECTQLVCVCVCVTVSSV